MGSLIYVYFAVGGDALDQLLQPERKACHHRRRRQMGESHIEMTIVSGSDQMALQKASVVVGYLEH